MVVLSWNTSLKRTRRKSRSDTRLRLFALSLLVISTCNLFALNHLLPPILSWDLANEFGGNSMTMIQNDYLFPKRLYTVIGMCVCVCVCNDEQSKH